MIVQPARLEPQFVHRIWGARSLAPLFPGKTNLAEPVGEVWLTGNECSFADGPFAGRPLGEAWRAMPREWAGECADTQKPFPLLVKFLFPEDILSVQVHPDDDYARRHEAHTGWTGKTEMWHVIAAREGAEVLVGLKAEVTPESFQRAIAAGTAEDCLKRIRVAPGDSIFVPAGTVHTIGPGLVLCEIQENSDLTYRVYDYGRVDASGRPRPLHIEKALEVARFGPQTGGRMTPQPRERPGRKEQLCAACRYFSTRRWDFSGRTAGATHPDRFELLIILAGSGRLEWGGGAADYSQSQAWVLPAALGEYRLVPGQATSLLRTFVPGASETE
jgi:mannose-6-phosphate isomerase